MNVKSFIVLGGAGFIGRALVKRLVDTCNNCVAVVDYESNPFKDLNVEYIQGDCLDVNTIRHKFIKENIIINLASTTVPFSAEKNKAYDIESNLIKNVILLDEIKKYPLQRIIYISSGGTVYGKTNIETINENHSTNPICSYGIVKLAIEKYVLASDYSGHCDCRILRVSNPYGLGANLSRKQGLIPILIHKMKNDETIEIWGDGSTVKDYIAINDLIDAIMSTVDYHGSVKLFNIGTGIGHSIIQIIQMISNELDLTPNIRFTNDAEFDSGDNVLNCQLAYNELRWSAKVKLIDGISELCRKLI